MNASLDDLVVALDIIERSFPNIASLQVHVEQDPETSDEYIMIDMTIHMEIDEFLARYNTYTERLVASMPWPARNQLRLSYDIR